MSLFLVHVGQVEGDAYNVALSSVISFLFIVVDDVELTVLFAGRHVLEVIEI